MVETEMIWNPHCTTLDVHSGLLYKKEDIIKYILISEIQIVIPLYNRYSKTNMTTSK